MPQPHQQRSSITSLLRNVDAFLEEHQRLSGQDQHEPKARPQQRRPGDRTSEEHAASYRNLLTQPDEPHLLPNQTSNSSITSHTSIPSNTSNTSRPSTIFIDWDGYSLPIIRHRQPSSSTQSSSPSPNPNLNKPLPSLPSSSQTSLPPIRNDLHTPFPNSSLSHGIHAPYLVPLPRPRRIAGFDAETGFEWDWDGRILHVHCEDAESPHSDYFCVEGMERVGRSGLGEVEMEVRFTSGDWEGEEGEKVEESEAEMGMVRERVRRSRERVFGFIRRVFRGLRLGVGSERMG